jgi:AraC family transcriptional regulator
VCLTRVDGLDALHARVVGSGWSRISEITTQPWGARECRVTTPDGSILRFFETLK